MAKNGGYKEFDKTMTLLIIGAAAAFVLFLICGAIGIAWLRIITAITAIGLSVYCLVQLYLTKEWLKQRSLWLTTGFGGILLCTLVSLIANFP